MKIERNLLVTRKLTLEEFADQHDLTLVISELKNPPHMRFYSMFKNTRVRNSLSHGFGPTQAKAVRNYTTKISNNQLIIEHDGVVKEINVPELILWPRKKKS